MKATDRQRARHQALVDSPMDGYEGSPNEFVGDMSDDLAKYLPLATGAATEVAVSQLKAKEAADKAKAAKNSEAGQAQSAAQAARKNAALAQADAMTETDPNGPKHKAAAQYNLEAQAAEAKAAYFQQAGGVVPGGAGMAPYAGGFTPPSRGGAASFLTPTNIMIGAGVLGVGILAVVLLRGKRR